MQFSLPSREPLATANRTTTDGGIDAHKYSCSIKDMTAIAADVEQFLLPYISVILSMSEGTVNQILPCQFRRFAVETGRRRLPRGCSWDRSCLTEGAVAGETKQCQPAVCKQGYTGSKGETRSTPALTAVNHYRRSSLTVANCQLPGESMKTCACASSLMRSNDESKPNSRKFV